MGLFETLVSVLRQADPQGIPVPMLLPGATDGRYLAELGIQSYGFLPMALPPDFAFAQTVHGPNERVPASALAFGSEAMYQLLRRFGEGQSGPSTLSPPHPWDQDGDQDGGHEWGHGGDFSDHHSSDPSFSAAMDNARRDFGRAKSSAKKAWSDLWN